MEASNCLRKHSTKATWIQLAMLGWAVQPTAIFLLRIFAHEVAPDLISFADWAYLLDDFERTEAFCRESLALCRELDDSAGMASSLFMLGSVACFRGQFVLARSQLEEAAMLFQQLGESWRRGRCLSELARMATEQGQFEQACALLEESLGLYQALGNQERIGWVGYLQARTLFVSQQDLPRAQTLAEQSLVLFQELGDSWFSALPLGLLGEIHLVQGEWALAREQLEESVELCQEVGDWGDTAELLMGLARVAVAQGDLAAARRHCQESLAILHELGSQEFLAACLEGMGTVLAGQGMPGKAAALWGTAQALREAIGMPMHPVYRADYEQAVAAARRELVEEAFATAWAAGRTTTLERAITDALSSAG